MARKGARRNPTTGEFEPDHGGILYDAFHETGLFDRRKHDSSFLNRLDEPQKRRTVIPITLWPETVTLLSRLAKATGMSRGRVVDRLVAEMKDEIDKWEEKHGGEFGGGKDRLPMVEDVVDEIVENLGRRRK